DGKVHVWDLVTGKHRLELDKQKGLNHAITMSRDGKTVAIAGGNGRPRRFWDVTNGKDKFPFPGHDGAIRAVAVAPHGKHIATGGDNEQIHLWNTATGEHLLRFEGISGHGLAFSPDGQRVAAVAAESGKGTDNGVRPAHIWNAATGKSLLQI